MFICGLSFVSGAVSAKAAVCPTQTHNAIGRQATVEAKPVSANDSFSPKILVSGKW